MAKNAFGQDISFDNTGKMVFSGTPTITADQATQSRPNALAFQQQNLAKMQSPNVPVNASTTPTQGQVTNTTYQPGTLLPNETIIGTRTNTPSSFTAGTQATITPQGITPTQLANIPNKTTPVQATLLGADLATNQANQTAQQIVPGLSEAEKARTQSLQALIEQITGQKTQTQLQAENYGAVDTAQQELNDINNQILTEQNAQRRREEALASTGDLTAEQAQQKINETKRQSISKQADLSIIQMAKQNNYATAKEIADRKVQAQIESDKLKLDTLQFIYNENKELFNKKEQRQFEVAQAERERLLNKQEKELTQINDLALNALQNGASTSIVQKMQQAKTIAEATKIGGQFVGKLDRLVKESQIRENNAQTAKLNREAQIDSGLSSNNVASLQAYANEFAQTGKVPSPTDLAKVGVTVAQVTQYAKQIPKQTGAILDRNTGVTPSGVSAAQIDGIQALYDVRTKLARMKQLDKDRVKGISGGIVSKLTGTGIESEYNTLREEVIGLISKARSGLTLTATEAKRYENALPGAYANPLGLGASSEKKLQTLDESIAGTLNSQLAGKNLIINGYSKVNLGGTQYTVGDVINIGGQPFRVLPDGTLTDVTK